MEENNLLNHGIILENRKQLSLTGVNECIGFDEETIQLNTKLGKLTIKGAGLHIQNYNTDTGELSAEGKIHAIVYTASDNQKSFLGKIFR